MSAVFPEKRCLYASGCLKEKRGNAVPEVAAFAHKHGFFSLAHPLIGVATESEQDTWLVSDLLKTIYDKVPEEARALMTLEVLTKILAFRALREGQEILIPVGPSLVRYFVDKVILLDEGMPAYGLVAESESAPSLLLFRGTDLTWKGRRSVASDLDLRGVGYTCFLKAHPKISFWLKSVPKPRALGYSLGGIFAAYTLLFESDLLECAYAFDPPGFSSPVYEKWRSKELDQRLSVFVTRGDCVSKYGKLVGTVRELSLERKLGPITAHTLLVTAEPSYFLA